MAVTPSSRRRFGPSAALLIVCLGALLAPLDSTVNTAFPVITAAFGLPLRDIQWVVVSYVIAQTSLTIVFGRIGDLYGHQRVFAIGLAACVVTHAAAALAGSYGGLIAARVFQGIAVGMTVACAPALATLMFPPAQKRRIVAFYVMAVNVGMAAGPLLGGVLIELFGWPGVYAFRVPLAFVVLCLLPWLPEAGAGASVGPDSSDGGRPPNGLAAFDWAGALLMTAALTGVILALGEATRPAGRGWLGLLLRAAGCAAGWGFVRQENRVAAPVMRIEPFRSPLFSAVQLSSSVINFAGFSILLLVPYVTAGWAGVSIVVAGGVGALYPAGAVLGGLLGGRLLLPAMTTAHLGIWLVAAGLAGTAWAIGADARWPLAVTLPTAGFGLGLFQVGYMDATTSLLPEHERGIAGSLVSVTRLIGVVAGASGISWIHERLQSFTATFALLALLLVVFDLALRRFVGRPMAAPDPTRRV